MELNLSLNWFLHGLLIGLAIAAPVGPIGILCIRRTVANGRLSGFLSGLGAATADAVYGSIAALGLTALSSFLIAQQKMLALMGGIFLCYLGIKTVLAQAGSQTTPPIDAVPEGKFTRSTGRTLLADYASTLFLTLTNPLTILSFTAIFVGLGVAAGNTVQQAMLLIGGVFCGSALWWLILSTAANFLRLRFLSPGSLRWINYIAGAVIFIFGMLALGSIFYGEAASQNNSPQTVIQTAPPADADTSGFASANGPRPFTFPADHGPHPDYQTEWWYYTGNLQTDAGQRFGYQLTFFRRALLPAHLIPSRSSHWGVSQVYMAHFALTDIGGERYQAFEHLGRGAADLAGAQAAPFQVWIEDWQVIEVDPPAGKCAAASAPCAYRLTAAQDGISLDLLLTDVKGPVLQGDQGYSQKGPQPGQASYYYSLPRLKSTGSVQIDGERFEVNGESWMDHEFSTSALSTDQIGWDWFSVQLENGGELMVFQIRRADGSVDPFSSGTWINPDGSTIHLVKDDFQIEVQNKWQSTHTGAVYPSGWKLSIPKIGLALQITPYLEDQELNVSYAYWEGAVGVSGTFQSQAILGSGYVELTGYSGSMGGEF